MSSETHRQMRLRSTSANLFLSSVRLHLLGDQQAWNYFQSVQLRFARRELAIADFVHRNTVLLQGDTDLLSQLFPFLAPHTCNVTSSDTSITVVLSHPQLPNTQLVVHRSSEPASNAYYRTFQNS